MAVINGTTSDEFLFLYGSDGNDNLYAYDDRDFYIDFIYGKNGNDNLYGGHGDDALYGGDGNDNLYGGDGNDNLYGGDGNDILTGGAGINQFGFYNVGPGIDSITDFNTNSDTIVISGIGFGIGSGDLDAFMYDNDSGALFFNDTQFASLNSNLDFAPTRNIVIF